jgi:uncharacterized protein with HEPN domain
MVNTDLPNLLAILDAISQIELYASDLETADDLWADRKSFDAVMMNFVLIGEMVDRINPDLKIRNPEVPWKEIKDFRNIIAHNYLGIDVEEVWQIIADHLLPLRSQIQKIVHEMKADGAGGSFP